MSTWIAAAIALAAVTLTYFTCIRPMRRRQCGMGGDSRAVDKQLAELREELRILGRRGGDSISSRRKFRADG